MKIVKNKIAILLALVMIFEVVAPVASYALTSGPSQPEFNSFEPANSTQMVDLFTGDFTYNIPLLNVPGSNGGYPINLFYNSVTNVEQEASMVGLGWNIGVGSINRQMRGIPDDFSGESIRQFTDRKPSRTVGLNATIGGEVLAFDSAKNNFGLELSLRSSLSYSNYKGLGYSYGFQGTTRFHKRFGVSFGSNYSSHDGITSSTGLSLFKRGKDDKATNEEIGGLTLTSNSLSGIKTISLNPSEKFLDKFTGSSVSYSTSDRPTFVPSYELPYFGSNITLGLKTGLEIVFTEPYQTTYGSYRTQTLHNNRRWTSIPTYGYLYLENDKIDNNGNGSSLLDFNRIKDGAINEYHTNLAIPFATEDYFSLSGHGTGGVFKLQRNDIGYFRDRNVTSATGGGSAILEGGLGGTAKAGADIELNYSLDKVDINSTSLNQVVTNSDFDFKGNSIGRESKYFFLNSEMTAELNESENSNHKLFEDYSYIGKDDLLTFDVDNAGLFDRGELKGNLKDESKNIVDLQNGVRSHRKPRGTNIQYFTNNELLGKIGPPLANGGGNINTYDIPQFKIPGVQRLANDQIGAFVVTDKSGVRWNYGLPVINKDHKELTFSVEQEEDQCKSSIEIDYFTNSDRDDIKSINNKIDNLPGNSKCENLLEAKEIPSYAHSHLLTSILSDDYVDNDYLDGLPNDKDFGGWVKFTYLKASDYKWRVPFFGANYIPGLTGVSHDDKASFVYGEREQYYPQTIETNSHIAKFTYSNREDGRGASYVLQNTADILDKSAYSLKLDKIELFAKGGEEKLIKTVNFTFDENYSLCPQVHNNLNGGGKLTLKEVSFTNYESNRASLNPYKFSYFNESAEDAIQYKYDLYNYDRWGVFKEHSLSRCDNVYEPFTEQSGEDIKNIQRENARAWHLKSIVLPSGSSIELDIERDDYAYVQNHQAMKMFQIAGIGELAGSNVSHSDESNLNYNKIFFKLEDPTNEVNDLDKYLDGLYEEYRTVGAIEVEQPEYRKQVFFKINSDLLKDGNYEYVDFAAYIKDFGLCTDGSCMEDGKSAYGYIEIEDYYLDLKFGSLTNGNAMIHPFLLSSWQFIKSNLSTEFMQSDEFNIPFSVSGILELLREMANSFPIVNLFRKGFYTKCADEDFASTIDLSSSFIRLNVPNKIKYGGGVRVASVMMTNTWNNALEETPVYGTVYNYETVEENGEIISSGVAANEPIVGKQENAYYYMKRLRQDLKFNVDDFKFELHPYNDQSLPSSVVGYSKVSVSSLASNFKYLKHKGTADDGLYNNHFVDDPNLGTQAYESISTTGKTVHEFYTAKDFPVVTKESIINSSKYSPRFIPLLWVGSIKTDIMVSSQAYNAEINDMHGKPLKTTYISQNKDGSYLEDLPISSVEYKYHDFTEKYKFGDRILERKRLSNEVDILTDYLPKATQSTAQIYKGELGVSRMLNLDIRNNSHVDISGGMEFNLDVVGYPPFLLFVPSAIPEFTLYDSEFTSGVTNKVISKKGILKEVIVSDGLSKIQTENLAYDPYCGNAVLSRTTNEYEKDKDGNNSYVYDYKIPAYMGYDKLGPSYENANLKFSVPYPFTSSLPNLTIDIEGPVQTGEVTRSDIFLHVGPELDSKLKVGDDYILRLKGINSNSQIVSIAERISEGSWRVDPYGIELNNIIAEDPFALQDVTEFEFTLLRSGNRNNLTAPGQSIKALSNPTQYASVQEVGVNTYLNGGDSDGNEETVEGLLTKDITIDKVLDASVAEYSEKWETAGGAYTYDACASPPSSSSSSSSSSSFSTATVYYFDKFRKGGRGIYRLKSNSSYRTEREYYLNNELKHAEERGTFNDFSLFNWKDPFYKYSLNGKKWLISEEITKYSKSGLAVESKNALNVYSSVLLGDIGNQNLSHTHNGDRVVGTVANSRRYESAYSSFESYELLNDGPFYNGNLLNNIIYHDGLTGTLQVENVDRYTSSVISEVYNIIGILNGLDGKSIIIDKPYTDQSISNAMRYQLYLDNGSQIKEYDLDLSSYTVSSKQVGNDLFTVINLTCADQVFSDFVTGRVSTQWNISEPTGGSNYVAEDYSDLAHTGDKSLRVTSGTDNCVSQVNLDFQTHEKYVLSAWINSEDMNANNTADFNDNSVAIKLQFYNGNISTTLREVSFIPKGNRIDGWQRLEGVFEVLPGEKNLGFCFEKGDLSNIVIDDLRIFPEDGLMKTYVYNPENQLLMAELDENNYFLKYIYNKGGELVSILKETDAGIISLNESRSYLSPTNSND